MTTFSKAVQIATLPLRATARRFARDEDASMSVEAALMAPLLFWSIIATYTYFDAYRVRNLAIKSNYAVSDLLSREEGLVNDTYLAGAKNLFRYLTRSGEESWVRVSVVHCEDGCAVNGEDNTGPRTLAADWSKATDGVPTFTDQDINDQLDEVIPLMASGERLIVVETYMEYDPLFPSEITGISGRTFTDLVITRPRFAPQLCWEGIGCGIAP